MINGLQGSADPVEKPGQAAAKLLEQRKRKTWTLIENQEIMKCYYETNPIAYGFQKIMMEIWKRKHPSSDVTDQRLMDQRRFIICKVFSELELQELEEVAKSSQVNDHNMEDK